MNLQTVLLCLFLLPFALIQCGSKKIDRYTVEYTSPYYCVNLTADTPVYKEPGEDRRAVYSLEAFRIVKIIATISLKEPEPIWYQVNEPDVKGYALSNHFRLFETLREAESFLIKKHPGKGLAPSFTLYHQAEQDHIKGHRSESIIKLIRFLKLNPNLEKDYSSIYFNTEILIAKLFIQKGEPEKAMVHLKELESHPSVDKPITLFGTRFNPADLGFHKGDMENYLSNQPYAKYQTLLIWEITYYMALIHERLKDATQAKALYHKLLNRKDPSILTLDHKIPYINFSIDRLTGLYKGNNPQAFLESLKESVDWKGNGRYLLYKLANTIDITKGASKTIALNYYKEFIQLFERTYFKNSYPGELNHYSIAKKRVKKLSVSPKDKKK
ncbi:MAG TPA: hypothetical protein ENI73_03060 [Spirochaetes bacterium]|nr:hypothetical protein [Spirochaetota bacterium]